MKTEGRGWEQRVLEHLEQSPNGRAGFKHLVRELGARGAERGTLEAALEALAAQGRLIELRGPQYALPGATQEYAAGRLSMHRDGYGFVSATVPPKGIRGDLFIPPGAEGRAPKRQGERPRPRGGGALGVLLTEGARGTIRIRQRGRSTP